MRTFQYETPAELIFSPQVPFSWTLRWAHAKRLRSEREEPHRLTYRIVGSTTNDHELAAVRAWCEEHNASLELDSPEPWRSRQEER